MQSGVTGELIGLDWGLRVTYQASEKLAEGPPNRQNRKQILVRRWNELYIEKVNN